MLPSLNDKRSSIANSDLRQSPPLTRQKSKLSRSPSPSIGDKKKRGSQVPPGLKPNKQQVYLKSLISGVGGNPLGGIVSASKHFSAGMSTLEAAKYLGTATPVKPRQLPNKISPIRNKRPANQIRKAEYDENQRMIEAIEEQQKIEWIKHQHYEEIRQTKKENDARRLRLKIKKTVGIQRESVLDFQKKFAVSKAAEVINIFEKLQKDHPSIKIGVKELRQNVLHNLIDRHKDKEADQQYWSMQLLIKLGLVPDPNAQVKGEVKDPTHDTASFDAEMSKEERQKKLEEVGLYIPQTSLDKVNKEMEKIAKSNMKKMQKKESSANPNLTKKEIETLKQLGLSDDQIFQLGPDENPFKDAGFADKLNVSELLEAQKEFSEKLEEEYIQEQKRNKAAERERSQSMGDATSVDSNVSYFDNEEQEHWSFRKKLQFQKERLIRLKEFFKLQRHRLQTNSGQVTVLSDYQPGELDLFQDMLQKMIDSKNAEIYRQTQLKRTESHDSLENTEEEEVEEEEDDVLSEIDSQGRPKVRIVNSGVIVSMNIDPDDSSEHEEEEEKDEEDDRAKKRRLALAKRHSQFNEEKFEKLKQVQKQKELRVKQKEYGRSINRKDKRDVHRFLMKHGLTNHEAIQYTQLGNEFNPKSLSKEQREFMEKNFSAQVFAFRKLRDKLLLNDNPADIYNIRKMGIQKRPAEPESVLVQKAQKKFYSKSPQDQESLVKTAQKEMTEEQIRLIRRREYYNRRVKQDFAPKSLEEMVEEETPDGTMSASSPSPSEQAMKRQRQADRIRRKAHLEQLIKKRESQPDWNPNFNVDEKPKPKYIKMSDRSILPDKSIHFNFRSRSIVQDSRPRIGQGGKRYAENNASMFSQDQKMEDGIGLQLPSINDRHRSRERVDLLSNPNPLAQQSFQIGKQSRSPQAATKLDQNFDIGNTTKTTRVTTMRGQQSPRSYVSN